MNRLAPLWEEPLEDEESRTTAKGERQKSSWRKWVKNHIPLPVANKSHLKILLNVLGCPLFPVPTASKHSIQSHVKSPAEYIMQHFAAASGCRILEGKLKSMFLTGNLKMRMMGNVRSGKSARRASQISCSGCFVMWQMKPDKWLIQLSTGGEKVVAGCDGRLAWRVGAFIAKGGVRPLRRFIQGLDPLAIYASFRGSEFEGEKEIDGVDCFVLKLTSNQADLDARSENGAEMMKHVTLGWFSQRTGLLVRLEDSCLTRVHTPGACSTYWEISMSTKIEGYHEMEGAMIAFSGHSKAAIARFGDDLSGLSVTRMEEKWAIDDVAFNIAGLSLDYFIPPEEVYISG